MNLFELTKRPPFGRVWLGGLISVLCLVTGAAPCKADLPGTVFSDEGRRAFEKGMIAAQSRLWSQAIQAFGQAQADAPINPDALYNLGLAYLADNQPLVGVTWLKAYLAATPDPPNAGAVEQEVRRQMLAWQVRIDAIIDQAFDAGMLLPKDDWIRNRALKGMRYRVGAAGYEGDLHRIARAIDDAYAHMVSSIPRDQGRFFADAEFAGLCRTEIGRLNLDACPDLIARMSDDDYIGVRSGAIAEYALALFKAGRGEEAERQLPRIADSRKLNEYFSGIIQHIVEMSESDVTAKLRAVEPWLARIEEPAERAKQWIAVIAKLAADRSLTEEQQSEIVARLDSIMEELSALRGYYDIKRIGDLLRRLNHREKADSWIRQRSSEALKDAKSWERVDLLVAVGDFEQARRYLEDDVIPEQKRYGGMSDMAKNLVANKYADIVRAMFERDKGDEARRLIESTPSDYRDDSGFADAYIAWGRWLLGKRNWGQAIEVLNGAFENPFDPWRKQEVVADPVAQAVLEGDMERALWLTTALKPRGFGPTDRRTPQELESHYLWVQGQLISAVLNALIAKEALDGALAYVEAAASEIHMDPERVVSLAEALVKAGRTEQALKLVQEDFGEPDAFGPGEYARRLLELARTMIDSGDGDPAKFVLVMVEEALSASRYGNTAVWVGLAEAWTVLGHMTKAREAADRAVLAMAIAGHDQHSVKLAACYTAIEEGKLAAQVHRLSSAIRWISLARELERKREIQKLDEKIRTVSQGDPGKVPEGLATIAKGMGEALSLVIRRERELLAAN